uniref:Mandelate racemase/muconate lactonizing enzyme, C-terminal domain protein n=1 Tax=Solibacter usitatus (strain Ellin6076) TaxID=234267 RepID=Q01RN2_SOLUE
MGSLNRRSFFRAGAGVAGAFAMENLSAAVQDNSTPYQRPKLKITDVKAANIQGFHVRIFTDQGLYGDGEGVDAVSGGPSIVQGFRSSLIGQSPLNIEGIWERIRTSGVFAGAQGGQYVATLTAVEIALWDLAGKALNMPIYQLMGGKVRDKIRVYCDSGTDYRDDPQAKPYIKQIIDNGFTMAKIDIDDSADPARFDRVNWTANNAEIDHMVDKVAFMRESLPKSIELAVDMHGRYDLPTAKRVAKELEPFKLVWLEEPVPAGNLDAMRDVRQSTHTPICAGENIYLRWGFREVFEKQALDIIMPDIQKCGGLMEGKKIADMAQAYYIPIAPHSQASPIGAMATAHMLATVPNFLVVEWHWSHPAQRWERWKQFVKGEDIIQKGYITVPDKPGIGVEMNEDYLKKLPGATWFPA